MDINDTQQSQQQAPPQQPVQPLEWTWIVQRHPTPDAQAQAIWKFGFIAADGGEVRVTLHQVGDDQAQQEKKAQEKQQAAQSAAMMGMPPSPPSDAFAPPGQPQTDVTKDTTFYATFFSNRAPHAFMNWDTSLSHEDSLQVWVTITHGLIDFMRKAQPANLILDDLANGKLKMVLRSVAMDLVAGNSAYTIETTKKHHYRTFFQVKKANVPSAFQAVNIPGQEQPQPAGNKSPADQGPTPPPQQSGPPEQLQQPPEQTSQASLSDPDGRSLAPSGQDVVPADDKTMAMQPNSGQIPPAFPSHEPAPIKEIPPQQRGLTVEIGHDYSVAVKDQNGNAIDRYRAKGPLDILRWINDKGYGGNRMMIVKAEMPSKSVQKKIIVMQPGNATDTLIKPVVGSALGVHEDFTVEGTTVKMHKLIPATQAALMNYIVNAPQVKCTIEAVEFVFETNKDMDFKKALVELAFIRTQDGHTINRLRNIDTEAADVIG